MGTKATIAVQLEDHVELIYCHYSGSLRFTGKWLQENYTTLDAVKELIALGDLSELAPTIAECDSYGRDQGETTRSAKSWNYQMAWFDLRQEYNYFFTNGKWYIVGRDSSKVETLLSDALTAQS